MSCLLEVKKQDTEQAAPPRRHTLLNARCAPQCCNTEETLTASTLHEWPRYKSGAPGRAQSLLPPAPRTESVQHSSSLTTLEPPPGDHWEL